MTARFRGASQTVMSPGGYEVVEHAQERTRAKEEERPSSKHHAAG